MNESNMEEFMQEILAQQDEIKSILTFDEAGMLTNDKGLVIRTSDGNEFQITIIQSR
ncbi:MAG: hypothetical protein ABFD79_12585 [Phycisphaerales bacterium]